MRPETEISGLKTDTAEDIMFLHRPYTRNLKGPNINRTHMHNNYKDLRSKQA